MEDLQCAQLLAKEHHRRKRHFAKLNKHKRRFIRHQHHATHLRHEVMHSHSHSRQHKPDKFSWLQAELLCVLDYETKSVYDKHDLIDIEDETFALLHEHAEQCTHLYSILLTRPDENDRENVSHPHIRNFTQQHSHRSERHRIRATAPSMTTLSSFFAHITRGTSDADEWTMLFPAQLAQYIQCLYTEPSERDHIASLLRSVRCWRHPQGQVAMIGADRVELVQSLRDGRLSEHCPLDVLLVIADMAEGVIVWLRRTGLNIVQWPALPGRDFFFSGYVQNEHLQSLLLGGDIDYGHVDERCSQYVDLDWCFVAFLLLGVVPGEHNEYFRSYFNQKLMSAIPGQYPATVLGS